MDLDSTIAAIASAPGGAARGIVRLSGPDVVECVAKMFTADDGRSLVEICEPTAISGQMQLPDLHSPLPCRLYLWPTQKSYTRQPSAELHTIGSPPLLQSVLAGVCSAGARLAGPGEFTLRAFLAGRIDLTQAEAVLGVIDAGDRRALDAALSQMAGGLGRPLAALREELLDLLAHLEAGLDFVEEDLDFLDRPALARQLAGAHDRVLAATEQLAGRGEVREVVRAVLVGLPNAGKSSLFNALAGADRALVSPIAGTTTDYVSIDLDLDGIICRLIDTAGRDSAAATGVGSAAQQQRDQQQRAADVEIYCDDAAQLPDARCLHRVETSLKTFRIIVLTKCDQALGNAAKPSVKSDCQERNVLRTSAVRGDGLAELRACLRTACLDLQRQDSPAVAATAARCQDSLHRAAAALAAAQEQSNQSAGDELIAAELRLALDELGQVVGTVYTDDLLDRIFSRFCIGK